MLILPVFDIISINKSENKVYIFTCFTHFNQDEQRQNFFLSILVKTGKICGLQWWVSLCWISKVPDMKSSVTVILSKLCYQKLSIMIIIYEETISSLAYAICASVSLIWYWRNFFFVGLDCEDVESGACFLVRDRPYLCYNENNKEQCCSTCQQLFTDIEGGTNSLLKFFITVLLVSIQHLPVNIYIWLENFNLIVLFGYNLLVNKKSEVNLVSARSLPFFLTSSAWRIVCLNLS